MSVKLGKLARYFGKSEFDEVSNYGCMQFY